MKIHYLDKLRTIDRFLGQMVIMDDGMHDSVENVRNLVTRRMTPAKLSIGMEEAKQELIKHSALCTLKEAQDALAQRAGSRGAEEEERSMKVTVNAFNAMFGKDLTETQGWQFMTLLKMGRSTAGYNADDYVDGAAYFALAGESANE